MNKNTISVILFTLILSFTSCNVKNHQIITNKSTEKTRREINAESTKLEKETPQNFLEFAERFMKEIYKENIFSFTHKDYGLFIFYNPGAFSTVQQIDNAEELQNKLYREKFTSKYTIKQGDIPNFSCAEEKWNKEGCFWKKDYFNIIINTYDLMLEFELIEQEELNNHNYEKGKQLGTQQTYAIYATDIVMGFYFVQINNKYYLYLIDAVDPCSA